MTGKRASIAKIAIFEGKKIGRIWNEKQEKWYFSVIDVVEILSGSTIPRRYWSDLKIKLQKEGSQVYENINQELKKRFTLGIDR